MGDFSLPVLGGAVLPIRASLDPQARPLAPVAASSGGQGAEARMDTRTVDPPRLKQKDAAEPDAEAEATKKIDEFTLIGPTPAFQANVLEIERDLKRTIERLEAERSRVEAEAAIKVDKAEARADRAEAEVTAPTDTPDTTAPAAEDAPQSEPTGAASELPDG